MFNICNNKSLINDLKCKQCSKILSVLPVYYCSAVGNICGRCTSTLDWMISNGTLEQAIAYEAVAKYLVFPCSNYEQGCEAKLKHTEVIEHEQRCKSILIPCPFNIEYEQLSLKCNWQGTSKNIARHLQADHNDFLQIGLPSFIMNVYDTHIKLFFTIVDNQMFLIVTQYLKTLNKFYCVVMSCEKTPENMYYRYQLEVGRYNDYFLILRKSETEPFSNVQEIVNNQEKMITVDVASINTMLNDLNGLIYCKISIMKKSKIEIAAINGKTPSASPKPSTTPKPKVKVPQDVKKPSVPKTVPTTSSPNISKVKLEEKSTKSNSFLDELECPICNHHMVPPIFICPTGHSICHTCKSKVSLCPMCRIPIQDTRNFTLENLATTLRYPCIYKNLGCPTTLPHEHMKLHELHCVYSYGRCPLKPLALCSSKEDIVDIIGHLRSKHASYVVEVNHQYSRDIVGKVTTSYWATVFENEIFIICCKHSSAMAPIKFNIVHVGMNKNKPKYKFELHFCDQTGRGLKLIVSQLCKVFPPDPSSALKKCLMLPQDLLDPFITKKGVRKVFFKFYIERLNG